MSADNTGDAATEATEAEALIDKLSNLWTAQQCADYIGVALRTWHGYVKRPAQNNPAPKPKIKIGNTPLWEPDEVRAFAVKRRRGTKVTF